MKMVGIEGIFIFTSAACCLYYSTCSVHYLRQLVSCEDYIQADATYCSDFLLGKWRQDALDCLYATRVGPRREHRLAGEDGDFYVLAVIQRQTNIEIDLDGLTNENAQRIRFGYKSHKALVNSQRNHSGQVSYLYESLTTEGLRRH